MSLPDWLKERRKALNLTQAVIASKFNLHQAQVSALENGKLQPDKDLLDKITSVYGIYDGEYTPSVVDQNKKSMPGKTAEALKAYRENVENGFNLTLGKDLFITADRNQYILHQGTHLSYFVDLKALLKYLIAAQMRVSAVSSVEEVMRKLDELNKLINTKFDNYDPAKIQETSKEDEEEQSGG